MDLFELIPKGNGLPTGAKINYNASNDNYDFAPLGSKGFATPEKEIDSIAVTKDPTNKNYTHGETVNLAWGELTVTYKDGTTDILALDSSGINIKTGSPADVTNPNVVVSYKGFDAPAFPITVTDPVIKFVVKTPMADLEYNHDENLDFTGLTFEATKKSNQKLTFTASDIGTTIIPSETKANVDSPNFTQSSPAGQIPKKGTQIINFTYEGITASQTVIVNDTIDRIDVIAQPTKQVYKYGENLELEGAVVQVTLGSGTTSNIRLPDGSINVSTFSNTTVGSKQQLTVSLAGKTAPTKIEVECYDYVISHTLVAPTKWEYEIGETPLNLTGGRLRLTWAKKGLQAVDLTSSMVSAFDSSTAGIKTIDVTYNLEYTLSDGTTKIPDTITDQFGVEVENKLKTITIKAPNKTTYKHGETIDFAGGVITRTYSDGTSNTSAPFASAIIKETDGSALNMSPAYTAYGSDHKISKTLKISYTEDRKNWNSRLPNNINKRHNRNKGNKYKSYNNI